MSDTTLSCDGRAAGRCARADTALYTCTHCTGGAYGERAVGGNSMGAVPCIQASHHLTAHLGKFRCGFRRGGRRVRQGASPPHTEQWATAYSRSAGLPPCTHRRSTGHSAVATASGGGFPRLFLCDAVAKQCFEHGKQTHKPIQLNTHTHIYMWIHTATHTVTQPSLCRQRAHRPGRLCVRVCRCGFPLPPLPRRGLQCGAVKPSERQTDALTPRRNTAANSGTARRHTLGLNRHKAETHGWGQAAKGGGAKTLSLPLPPAAPFHSTSSYHSWVCQHPAAAPKRRLTPHSGPQRVETDRAMALQLKLGTLSVNSGRVVFHIPAPQVSAAPPRASGGPLCRFPGRRGTAGCVSGLSLAPEQPLGSRHQALAAKRPPGDIHTCPFTRLAAGRSAAVSAS